MPPKRTVSAPRRTPPSTANSNNADRRASKSGKAQVAADASWSLPSLPDSILMRPPERWVCVHFKLLHISLLDDVVRLPPSATLHTLEARLMAHHRGAVKGIEMYKHDTQPKNKLRDYSLTLKEAFNLDDAQPATVAAANIPSASGIGPALVLSPEDHHVVVNYDFKSHDSDCPLLNRSPRYHSGQQSYTGATTTTTSGANDSHQHHHNNTTIGSAANYSPGQTRNLTNNNTTNSQVASSSPAPSSSGAGGAGKDSSSGHGGIGLSAPLTLSTSDGGVGVGSGRGK